jgi:hypothetical protein
MGMFDRWRRGRSALSSPSQGFEALAEEMTRQGDVIITRDGGIYTVYWTPKQVDPLNPYTSAEALRRSVEGKGVTVLAGMLDCRAQAIPTPHKPAAG